MDPRGTENLPVPAARLQQKQKVIKLRNSSHQNKGSFSPRMRTRVEKLRNMHTQNQPIGHAPRHSSKAGAIGEGGTPNQKGKMLGGTPHPRQTRRLGTQPDYTLLGSALLQYPSNPRRVGGEGERAAGPRILTSRTRFVLCVQPPTESAC